MRRSGWPARRLAPPKRYRPFYSDKYAKIGIQLCDLFDEKRLMERLTAACDLKMCSLST